MVSLKQALSALGFKGGTRMETELNQWVAAEKQQLASIMLEHGIEWEQKGTHEKHLSLLDFEKQERVKEVAALEEQKAGLEEHNATMQEVNKKWLNQLENIEREISYAHENRAEADKQADQAKKKVAQYEKKLTEIAPMVKEMERFAEKYSADPEEVLPEAGTLETGKSYREKKAKPLIRKIVTVLRSVYRAYLDLSRRFNDMQRSYERAWSKVNSLTDRVEELWNENRILKERLGDFSRVERALGQDMIENIVQKEKMIELAEKEQREGTETGEKTKNGQRGKVNNRGQAAPCLLYKSLWKVICIIMEGRHFAVPNSFFYNLETLVSMFFDILSPEMNNSVSEKK